MELKNKLTGCLLIKIQKGITDVKLTFEDKKSKRRLSMSFSGLLFETPFPAINRTVERIEFRNTLGFKAMTQLCQLGFPIDKYGQLLIEMSGSNSENKIELICVFEKYRIRTTNTN